MKRVVCMFIATGVALAGSTVWAAGRLPGTLNFQDVTGSNVNQTVNETASNEKEVAYGDFDNDGDLDVLVGDAQSDFGQRRNKLYRNNNGVFLEISGAPAIPGFSSPDVTRNAFFRDFDGDGWLDILIINDGNTGGPAGQVKVYINKQVGGVFDHFDNEGTSRVPGGVNGPACSAQSEDFDADGDIDFYSANYPNNSQDRMWFNRDDLPGFFQEVTSSNVPNDNQYTVDAASADINNDGTLDLLLSNWVNSGGDRIYYNNLNSNGSGVGDFKYAGSTQTIGIPGQNENAMEPADFDGDGRIDIYHTNGTSGGTDIVRRNTGNSASGQATFAVVSPLPVYVRTNISVKATAKDLNHDGRMDVVVMMQNGRPAVLRNTTVNGDISFVDWSPAQAFPPGTAHRGWHAAAFDADGDGWEDIFLGGWTNDHLFVNVPSNEVDGEVIGDALPAIFNTDPVAVTGSVTDSRTFTAGGVPGNVLIASVLHSASDLTLELVDNNGNVLASSDRGALGVEEAFQSTTSSSGTNLRVKVNALVGDRDEDGDLDVFDFAQMEMCVAPGMPASPSCTIFDFNQDGSVDVADVGAFQIQHSGVNVPASASFILEALARTPN